MNIKDISLKKKVTFQGKIVSVSKEGTIDEKNLPLDLSMTKTVIAMLSSAIIGLLVFLAMARSYKKTGISYPKGFRVFLNRSSFLSATILQYRILGLINWKIHAISPFGILLYFDQQHNGANSISSPFGANVTGNIAITFVLACCTFIVIQFSGNNHIGHMYSTPGVPIWLLPIMIPVEINRIIFQTLRAYW